MSQESEVGVTDKLLERVRNLVSLAEHPDTPEHEADAARQRADALMFKYSIDQATLDQKKSAADRQKPIRVKFDLVPESNPLIEQFGRLANIVALHCRCLVIQLHGWGDTPAKIEVFGFESDVRYFEMLYTTLYLHMNSIFFPKPDGSKSRDDNLIQLRGFGMNWLDMARVYGWKKMEYKLDGKECWKHQATGEEKTNFQLGGQFKKAYHAAMKARGLEPDKISSAQSRKTQGENYRFNAAQGYVDRIYYRLRASMAGREPGSELVLKDRSDEVLNMMDAAYPNRKQIEAKRASWNWDAYDRGQRHANSADLNGGARLGGDRTALGG